MDNEFILFDRLEVIRKTIQEYGEENFYLSFSGGKDSTVLHHLLDMALPENRIPRVFINTGIEYVDIVKFVKGLAENDDRFVILNNTKNIKEMLEKDGYPFKSKAHAKKVHEYQVTHYLAEYLRRYVEREGDFKNSKFSCPEILKYQFTDACSLKISHLCCDRLKKDPRKKWAKKENKTIGITGMRGEEGGARAQIGCIITGKDGKIKKFHPMIKVNNEWEEWFIQEYGIKLCRLYYEPFNFDRTGCKGCPFALTLKADLETMEKYLPNERKQCEILWKPVYDEYRRLGYRLKKDEQLKLF